MKNFNLLKISGGDKVKLKDGSIIKVSDMNSCFIFATNGDIYYLADVIEIVERYRGNK